MDAHAQSATLRPRRSARTGRLLAALTAVLLLVALLPALALAETSASPDPQATAAQADPSQGGDAGPPAAESVPADPPPADPAPTDPAPTDPAPSDPAPDPLTDPAPAPTDPAPAPAPVDPALSDPAPADPLPADPMPVFDDPILPVEREIVKAPAKTEPAPSRPGPEPAGDALPSEPLVAPATPADTAEDDAKAKDRHADPTRPSAEALERLGIPTVAAAADETTATLADAMLQACSASLPIGTATSSPETVVALAERQAEHRERTGTAPQQVRGPPVPFHGPTSPVAAGAAVAAGAGGQGSAPDCALEAAALVLELSDEPIADLPSFADHTAPASTHVAARAPPVA